MVAELRGRDWVDRFGRSRRLTLDDIVIVAPYNAQVATVQATIERRLGARARVGTVDKFQGQEAPVAIYSMAASSADDAPRGMAFLYDGHRLNVAVSRAMGLALVVASPDRLPEQLRFPFNTDQHLVLDSSRIREELSYAERGPQRDAARWPGAPIG